MENVQASFPSPMGTPGASDELSPSVLRHQMFLCQQYIYSTFTIGKLFGDFRIGTENIPLSPNSDKIDNSIVLAIVHSITLLRLFKNQPRKKESKQRQSKKRIWWCEILSHQCILLFLRRCVKCHNEWCRWLEWKKEKEETNWRCDEKRNLLLQRRSD